MTTKHELDETGIARVESAVDTTFLTQIADAVDSAPDVVHRRRKSGVPFAVREAHAEISALRELLTDPAIVDLAAAMLDGRPELVTATFFDKVPGANWAVPAHQDVYVPVNLRGDAGGWTNISRKGQTTYAEPPIEVLGNLLAIRLHLDDCPDGNGSLEVVPGTHDRRLTEAEIGAIDAGAFIPCPALARDALLMRPLLVHRSQTSQLPNRRRVLHAVYFAARLPDSVVWT